MTAIPMRETPEDRDVRGRVEAGAAQELRSFIERIEQLDAEKRDAADRCKEVYSEAKFRGYDAKVIRKIVALRRRAAHDVAEEEAVLDLYKAALGMT